MTRIKIGESVFLISDEQWEDWVRGGRIPADAWILSPSWTKGVWRLADSLEVYHLFLPSKPEAYREPAPGLTETIFPRRGLSITEALVLINLLTTGILFLLWRDMFSERVFWLARFLRNFVGSGKGFFAAVVPMFLHANPSHLFYNMIALTASGAVTEYFYGRGRMLAAYLVSGFGAAALSLVMRPKPVLSVGASGAIFGLYGLAVVFLLRHFRSFNAVQRWKTFRIYLPLAALAVFPSLAGERVDFYAHLGGFLTGGLLGVLLPAGPRVVYISDPERIGRVARPS